MSSTRTRAALVSALTSIASAGCGEPTPSREWTPADHVQPSAQAEANGEREPAQEASAGAGEDSDARAARALWLAACASCHGREGRGDGPSPPPGARLPDFSAAATLTGKNDEQLATVIRDGRGMMPAFGKQIVEAGVTLLVRHVRGLAAGSNPEGSAPGGAVAPAGAPSEGTR